MLIVTTVSPGVVSYFLDGRHPGRWSPAAGALLGLDGPVQAVDLRRLLQGRHPAIGAFLPRVRPHRRRAGWDLMFAAPKSLSLLASTSVGGAEIERAHAAAVSGVLDHLERGLVLYRKGLDGGPARSDGMLSAAFEHRESAAGEPHLHTHVLVANLGRADGEWGAVVGSEWFIGRRGLAALYHLELRAQLRMQGWNLPWRLRPDGLADLADIPREAVRAASTQSRLVSALGRYPARAEATAQPWAERIRGAGMPDRLPSTRSDPGSRAADRRVESEPLSEADLARRVSVRLSVRRSDFARWDVVVALAASQPEGATVDQAMAWAERFCRDQPAVPSRTALARWTTPAARRMDEALAEALRAHTPRPPEGDPGSGSVRRPGRPERVVADLTAARPGVHFLGAPAGRSQLLAQAEVIDSCRQVWADQGRRVAVAASAADGAAARWAVLSGVTPYRPGDRPDVLIVDRADRRTSPELNRLLAARASTLVFVEGGTMPRLSNPASHGLMEVANEVGRHVLAEHALWAPGGPDHGLTGRAAAQGLLAEWCGAGDERPLLVGLGVEETAALNRAVLALRPGRTGDGAEKSFRPGDRVVVIKGRPGLPAYATFGTVVESEGSVACAERAGSPHRGDGWTGIAWDSGETTRTTDRHILSGVGFGYAVSAHMAGRTDRPLMVLGPADALARGRERVVHAVGVGLDIGGRAHGLDL